MASVIEIKAIDKTTAEVEIINSIKDTHKDLRQMSKAPTFALTYQAVAQTLVKNCGFTQEKAQQIFDKFHELYKESDVWVNKKLEEAEQKGYLTVAFGLRIRTPKIKQSLMNSTKTPREAEEERRTAANALGQSWGLLNTRAGIEFNELVRQSIYKDDIKPCAQIHDAQYFIIKDQVDVLLWANKNLLHCVSWQDNPEIAHDLVHLGGEFSIFYPDWAHELSIPNQIDEVSLIALTSTYLDKINDGKH